MMRKIYRLMILVGLMLMMIPITGAQDNTYTDSNGLFSVPIPADWTNNSTDVYAHFTNEAGSADIYVMAFPTGDLDEAIALTIGEIGIEGDVAEMQRSDVPLPGGVIWTQVIQFVEGGQLIANIGYVADDGNTYVVSVIGTQASIATSTPALNNTLLNFQIIGGGIPTYQVPDYADESTFTEQDITVVTGDYELPGTLTLPEGDGPFPAVVLVQGSGSSDRNETIGINKPFQDIAQGLASQGIASIRYDKRTFVYGAELADVMSTFTVNDETVDDAISAVNMLAEMDVVDSNKIYVIGHSLGAIMAPRIAEMSDEVDGLIMMAGSAISLPQSMINQGEFLKTLENNQDPQLQAIYEDMIAGAQQIMELDESSASDEMILNAPIGYWLDLINYDQVAVAQSLDIPMLILQGENDYQSTMDDFAVWQEALGAREDVELISYPGLFHLFIEGEMSNQAYIDAVGNVDAQVINDIVNWINAQ